MLYLIGCSHTGKIPASIIKVGEIMREAVVAELNSYGKEGKLREIMSRIYQEVPGYSGFGRCQYPHPPQHNHPFIYTDAIDCLIAETKAETDAVLYSWVRQK